MVNGSGGGGERVHTHVLAVGGWTTETCCELVLCTAFLRGGLPPVIEGWWGARRQVRPLASTWELARLDEALTS